MVIQGEYVRFGNTDAVREHLKKHDIDAKVIEIPNADHSYNNSSKEPEFQNLAVETPIKNI